MPKKPIKLNKTEQALIDQLQIGTENETVRNPYSGASVELNPTEVALYDYIKGCEATGLYTPMQKGLSLFAKLNANAYMILLD